MTIKQLIKRLSKNAAEFLLAGDREKSNACMELLELIYEKGYQNVQGKLVVDNL